jgi:hypothetical protein
MTRLRHWWLAVTTLPLLLFNPHLRSIFVEMQSFCRSLPSALRGNLLEALKKLTLDASRLSANETNIRRLADLAALLDRKSPLGLCLRRSLTRYYFLRRMGLPVVLQFGARFASGKPDREVSGHAWLTLNGQPYHEADENFKGFTVIFSFPSETL